MRKLERNIRETLTGSRSEREMRRKALRPNKGRIGLLVHMSLLAGNTERFKKAEERRARKLVNREGWDG